MTGGLYHYMRNPMYLGSFLLGCGFVLIVWPWWSVPIFAYLFHLRFKKQIVTEEKHLTKLFGEEYTNYCKRTPGIFPNLKSLKNVDVKECFPWKATWSTQEKRGLIAWPCLAVALETLQEKVVLGIVDIPMTIMLFITAAMLFSVDLWCRYKKA